MRRFALTDEQWDKIKDCLPGQDWDPAIFYLNKTGCQWRYLPEAQFKEYL